MLQQLDEQPLNLHAATTAAVPVLLSAKPSLFMQAASQRSAALALKTRFSGIAEEEISPEQVLFHHLCYIYEPDEAQAVTQKLFDHFGSLASILSASASRLSAIVTNASECVALLKSINLTVSLVLREPLQERPILDRWSELEKYLRATLSSEEQEVVRLLLLDSKNALIKDKEHARGTENQTPIYPREIIRAAIDFRATALIIVHNHPSGYPDPSDDDIRTTHLLSQTLSSIGIKLHDHVIVGRRHCESMRRMGLMR